MADVKELNINSTTYDIKAKSVVDTNSGSLKFWSGDSTDYGNIVTKDATTLYNVDDGIVDIGDLVDGQWVNNWDMLYQAEDCPPSTDVDISLSSYLPNDSYNYEILVNFGLYTNSNQSSQVRIEFSTGLASSVRAIDSISATSLRTLHTNTCILPVSSAHVITLKGLSWSQKGELTVTAFAYRRLGSNV